MPGMAVASTDQRVGKAGDDLHEIGLPGRARLLEQVPQVGPDRRFRKPEHWRHVGDAARLHEGHQDPELGGSEPVMMHLDVLHKLETLVTLRIR